MNKAFKKWYRRHSPLWGVSDRQQLAYKRVLRNAFNAGAKANDRLPPDHVTDSLLRFWT